MSTIRVYIYYLVFQKNERRTSTVFDISYYKVFKKYLLFLGQFPNQSRWSSKFNVTVMTGSLLTFYFPAFAQIFTSLYENDLGGMLEGMPVVASVSAVLIKLLNHEIYKKNFEKMFDVIKKDWKLLNDKSQTHILEEITKQGNKIGEIYRTFVLSCMSGFIVIPLYPAFLDIIIPLNETRQRHQMFRLTYFLDENRYFYPIYFHSLWCSFVTVMIAVTIDSLYIQIVHHDCAIFAICGQNIITATGSTDVRINETYTERFRQCLTMHKNALQLFEMLDDSSRRSFFFQILLTMVGMTITAVQAVINLHRPEEALRIGLFLVGQQFHLLIITLPGQVITDHSFELTNDIYRSMWYNMPINVQRVLHMMQMRSSKPCKLTAGGIYQMNIENFGITFKTCVSYFMVLLSLKD
ncbi:odorant receptor 9a-like isoform X1 [Bombus impatiens]|uniref:Odorant receptor n=1 Tax=Bombus impatiens TaxID=132113 RepID=A0A6P8LMK5_BOMIM|nr:odorant receptor 9a-like isoform X1 [Bombus impatiens]